MAELIKLKPCPFCGGEAKIVETKECWGQGENANKVTISCCECFVEIRVADHESYSFLTKKAIEKWNNRVTEADVFNKAIDDFVDVCKKDILCQTFGLHPFNIEQIALQLKESE